MSGKEYRAVRKSMRLTRQRLADVIRINVKTMNLREQQHEVDQEDELAITWLAYACGQKPIYQVLQDLANKSEHAHA